MSVCQSVSLSVTLCIVAKRYILQQTVSQQVKRSALATVEHDFTTFKRLHRPWAPTPCSWTISSVHTGDYSRRIRKLNSATVAQNGDSRRDSRKRRLSLKPATVIASTCGQVYKDVGAISGE